MNRYILSVAGGDAWNAASKAWQDVEKIAVAEGCHPVRLGTARTADGAWTAWARLLRDGLGTWRRLLRQIPPDSLLLLQYPYFPVKFNYALRWLIPLAQRRGIKVAALVHDLNSLRGQFGRAAVYGDSTLLKRFDAVICHNQAMRRALAARGVPDSRLVTLDIFDYLTDAPFPERGADDGVAVAGNLSPEKSGYVAGLMAAADGRFPLHLYGSGLGDAAVPASVTAHGAVPPDALPGVIEGAFGLVWDGPEAGTCAGRTGEYLRYNDPHKLSLYLAAGMPVLLWEEAATAEFVREQDAGLLIASLDDIPARLGQVTPEAYARMRKNALRIGRALREGQYVRRAIRRAESVCSHRKGD